MLKNFLRINIFISLFFNQLIEANEIPKIKKNNYEYENPELEYVITKKDCNINIDNSNHFGPIRDQDGVGFCWAFAGADLYGEYLCSVDTAFCGKNLSVLSGMFAGKNNWKYSAGIEDEGGNILSSIEGFMFTQALCEEKFWKVPSMDSFFCKIFNNNEKCFKEKFYKVYHQLRNEIEENEGNPHCTLNRTKISKLTSEINSLVEHKNFSEEIILDLILENDFENFSKIVLVPTECLANNISVASTYGKSVALEFKFYDVLFYERDYHTDLSKKYRSQPNNIKSQEILKGFKTGNSVAVTLCSKELLKKQSNAKPLKADHSNFLANNCGNHVTILTGMRWNDSQKRCEVKMRNSWGVGAPLNGWMDAQSVLNTIYKINYMERNVN